MVLGDRNASGVFEDRVWQIDMEKPDTVPVWVYGGH